MVTGANTERAKPHLAALEAAGVACRYLSVAGEPTVDLVREGAQTARYANFIIGFGGGSAIDAAKAIAAVAPNSGEPLDYLEVIGKAEGARKSTATIYRGAHHGRDRSRGYAQCGAWVTGESRESEHSQPADAG